MIKRPNDKLLFALFLEMILFEARVIKVLEFKFHELLQLFSVLNLIICIMCALYVIFKMLETKQTFYRELLNFSNKFFLKNCKVSQNLHRTHF